MTGPLTFLFTDLENSTPLWENYPVEMRQASARHDALLRAIIEQHRGWVVKTTGDGFHAVFESPADGVAAALAGQLVIGAEPWPETTGPLKVRIGLHTGESQEREGDYFGAEVNLAARVMGLGHGGQVLLSDTTATLVKRSLPENCSLLELGEHRLKGISAIVQIHQLCHPDLAAEFPALKSLATFKHNLHRQLSTFIGREKELGEVKRLLKNTPLLTLLGPGGTGKTRLMLQVAEEVIEDYPDGVWLVELAPLTDPALIPERVAASLNLQEQPGRKIFDTLAGYLRRRELLLLLDNVEHIVQASAEFTEQLLEHCPKLTMLITGREALFIEGETAIQVPPLSLPKEKQTLEEIAGSEGVQLFLERARAVRPDFALTEGNGATIAEVVRRLDGIPLALELAAARLRMLTIEQINEHLNDRFRLLTGGRRTALPRQQTLQALIDWSWQLLDQKEQILLRRLSVFSGGWDLEAAQTVTGFNPLDTFDVFDQLEQLINKSLITVAYPPSGEARYGMLESIRQFAQDKLFEANEGEILRDRHADYFVKFAQESEYHLVRDTMVSWVKRILLEMDNLRAVLTWTFDDRPELALRISSALLYHWAHWIHPSEARNWLETSIDKTRNLTESQPGEDLIEDLIKAYLGLGIIHSLFGENLKSVATIDEGIALAREYGDLERMTHGIAWRINVLIVNQYEISPDWEQEVDRALEISEQHRFEISEGWLNLVKFFLYAYQGEFAKAFPHFQRVIEIAGEFNNPRINANVLQIQARMAALQGEPETAKDYFLKAIDDFRAINDQRNVLHSKSDLAHLYRRTGKFQEARQLYRETIKGWQEEGSLPAVAHQLECFAITAIASGNNKHAARLLGRAKATREELNTPSTDPLEIFEMEQAMKQLAGAMGEVERDRVMAEGSEMSMDEAVALALSK
ncbi:MAG: adenylate/guanylate cyclase domain-containing protein [Anaerolineales bacterium]|jgi:predicted ATPase/class 3 adenylate cyclase